MSLSVLKTYHGPPKPTFLEVSLVNNNQIFRWPRPLFFMVLGAHGKKPGKVPDGW